MTDTSELVEMVEELQEQWKEKEMREDIAELERLTRQLARAKGIDVPDSPSQNGDGTTWNVFNDG
jgi:hypothetical protein